MSVKTHVNKDALHSDPFTITVVCVVHALLDIGITVQSLQGSCLTVATFWERVT